MLFLSVEASKIILHRGLILNDVVTLRKQVINDKIALLVILLNFLYNIYYQLGKDSSIFEKIQIKKVLRFLIRMFSNQVLPRILYKSTENLIEGKNSPIVVSMTTFPKRIQYVWLTIETILCQSHKPNSIILWLSQEQFPRGLLDLPQSLIRQIDRGLQIRFVEGDFRSHKKYYYSFQEFTNKYIVTIDDDMFFPTYFLESMLECKRKHPNDVIASFGSRYMWNSENNIIEYIVGPVVTNISFSDALFGTGGGTLFEPNKFIEYMDDLNTIFSICPTEDDMYINALMKIAGINTTYHMNGPLLNIIIPDDTPLMALNGKVGDADSNNSIQVNHIIKHMILRFGKNPFDNNSK